MLAQIGQRSCGCPKPQSVQSQVERGFEEPDLVIDVPANGRRDGTKLSFRFLPTPDLL